MFWTAIVCVGFFSVVGIGSVLAAAFNIDNSFPNPMLAATLFALIYGFFILLGGYLVVFQVRYRLSIGEDGLTQTGVFTNKELAFNEIRSVNWRTRPTGGSALLQTPSEKVTIHFGNFEFEQRSSIIQLLRRGCGTQHQDGWQAFSKIYEPTDAVQSCIANWLLPTVFFVFGASFVVFALRGDWGYLFIAIINFAMGLFLLFRKKRERRGITMK